MKFSLEKTDSQSHARAGSIKTDHGIVQTPIFMPVGTAASVKGVHQHELENDITIFHAKAVKDISAGLNLDLIGLPIS